MPWADGVTMVLGADGFLGRNFVEFIAARGWPLHAVGRAAGDFTDAGVAAGVFEGAPQAARIVHAITRQRTGQVQYAMQGELLRDNARIHLNVLDAWRRHQPRAKLITLGSSCVYPESDRPIPESAFRSGPPHSSVRGYALAKELLAVGCETHGAQYGLGWLHCILATCYGPHAHTQAERSHFMAALIARAVAARATGDAVLEVWGNPETVRDLLHVTDQIEAVLAADARFTDTIVNVTPNAPVTVGDCARAIIRALDWDARMVHPPGSFQGAGYKSLDSSRFLGATGWRPRIGLEEGVRLAVAPRGMHA